MNPNIVTAIIAAFVSLVVSLITFWATRSQIESNKERQERELQRKLTEKLYELRIAAYPKAFSITQGLLGNIIDDEKTTKEQIDDIREQLAKWASSDAAFILSQKSRKAYYRIRDALMVKPEENRYSKEQRGEMWKAKNKLRACLREDVALLFGEEEIENNDRNLTSVPPEPR